MDNKNNKVVNNSENSNEEDLNPQVSDDKTFNYQNGEKYIPGRGFRRYNNEIQKLIPYRKNEKKKETLLLNNVGLLSFISMSWISKFMYKAYRKGLNFEKFPSLSCYDTCDYNADRLEYLWEKELTIMGKEKASLSKISWKFCQTRILTAFIIQILGVTCGIVSSTILMRKLLEYIQSKEESYEEGLKYALFLTIIEIFRILFCSWSKVICYTTALRLRSACITLVYRKIISIQNFGDNNIGEIINIISNDAQRIHDTVLIRPMIIEAPILTIYGIIYILKIFGPLALLGIIPFVLYYPIQYFISRLIGYYQSKTIKITDIRIKLMNEILDCIKLIKIYAWEKRFSKDILNVRKNERNFLIKTSYCQSLNSSTGPMVPVISTVITFLSYISNGYNLTAAEVFPFSAFLHSRFAVSLGTFRIALGYEVLAGISFDRIKNILILERSDKFSVLKPIFKSQAIAISNGRFSYRELTNDKNKYSHNNEKIRKENCDLDKKLIDPINHDEYRDVLFDISFEIRKGKLIGICGQVGSGKSSLLLAALGQLRISMGQVARDGSCAYASQQAWITNSTLKENIVFGEKFDSNRYQEAIESCNLVEDIQMMPGGDETEIGEKGVNLSGGQKQRVALARALYSNRDIYLLDDPLSAVDSRVGSHIFNKFILEALKEKTVLFVTHQIQYLNRCDYIYVMNNGRIIEHGTHDELIKLGNEYASMVYGAKSSDSGNHYDQKKIIEISIPVNDCEEREKQNDNSNEINIKNDEKSKINEKASLTIDENLNKGTTKISTYYSYIVAMGGFCYSFLVFVLFLLSVGSTIFSSWWLALWIKEGGGNSTIVINNETVFSDNIIDNPNFFFYRTIYANSIGIMLLLNIINGLIFTRATIGASTKMHNNLFQKIISSPMRFFDTNPTGRIQHLFSRDMDEVDSKLPITVNSFIQITLRLILLLLVICVVFPYFILPIFILTGIYLFISKIFRVAISDLKRMENKSRAPVISFVKATVQGLNTIHAFEKEEVFMNKFTTLFDENSKHLFMCNIAITWLALRIDVLSVAITSIISFFIIFFYQHISPAFAGLALTHAAQISGILPYAMGILSEVEIRFISIERINHYIKTLVSEGISNRNLSKSLINWPSEGKINFQNVSMSYGDGDPLILKNVSFTVNPGEKIGIVGRTGSGKSSLTIALFRLVEILEGKIEIDDIDITSEININQLRTKLSIIPQDPVLFNGTIRSNLDPFNVFNDSEIWQALEKTQLKDRVQSINGQLDASVDFGGDNLSVGEKQLLCLARALLRNSKILVLDEATAAVDPETEITVQNTVQQEFSHCTILTIAHRLQTVLSLSRVLVMKDGKVLEFDNPSKLLEDSNSEFYKMIATNNKQDEKS